MQTKTMSIIESITMTVVGVTIGTFINYYIIPFLFDVDPAVSKSFAISMVFMVVSFIKYYTVRRWFNKFAQRYVD